MPLTRILRPAPGGQALAAVTAAIVMSLIGVGTADAQNDGDNEPSRIERRLEEVRPADRPDQAAPPTPETRPAPGQAAPLGGFILSAVVVEGSTVFEQKDFAPLYEDLLAERMGQSEIATLTEAITQKYREAGHVLSRAVVPPQRVVGGVLRVQVIEGYVDDVEIVGARHARQRLAGYFKGVRRARPLALAELERALLLLSDVPGITVVDSTLEPKTAPGAFRLRVQVERDTVEGVAYLDNRGTPDAGPLQSWTSLAANSALGHDEQILLGLFTNPIDPEELVYIEAQYLQPIGHNGTKLRITTSHASADSGGQLAASDTESTSQNIELRLTQPVLRTRDRSLWLHGTFDWFDQQEDRFGRTNFEDRLRVARLGAEWWQPDLWKGSFYINAEASQGLDVFGASESGRANLSRFDGGGEFTKAELEVRRIQRLTDRVSVLAKAKGQLSAEPLLSYEEFALGGSAYGRGYDFGEISGDDGAAGLIEIRLDGTPDLEWLTRWQLYGFYDLGTVWNDGLDGEFARQSLASAGVGVRLTLARNVFAGLEVAKPLTRTPETEGDKGPRAFFTLSAQF